VTETRRRFNFTILVVVLALGLGAARARAESPGAEAGVSTDHQPVWFHFLEEYRFRTSSQSDSTTLYGDEEQDNVVRLYGVGGFRDAADRFRADVALGAWFDVDGGPGQDEAANFASIYDTSSDFWFDVYNLTGEYRSTGLLQHVRLGRQVSELGRPVTFDGLSLKLRAGSPLLDFFLFGGRTVHFFETDADLFEDYVGSGGAVIRPLSSLRLEADYRFAMEDMALADETRDEYVDHSYGLTAWLHPADWLYVKAYGRGITDTFSHAGLATKLEWTDLNLGLQIGADSQLADLRDITELDNPYFSILGPSQAHTRWNASVWKDFPTSAGVYTASLGWDGRANHDSESAFNRDYGRLYLMLAARDIIVAGPFLQVALENHFAEVAPSFGDEGLLTAGGSAGYDRGWLRVEGGSYYQRYKYDYYRDVKEMEDVRTYFGALSVKPLSWLAIRARYQFENLDRDQHTLFFSLTQTY